MMYHDISTNISTNISTIYLLIYPLYVYLKICETKTNLSTCGAPSL